MAPRVLTTLLIVATAWVAVAACGAPADPDVGGNIYGRTPPSAGGGTTSGTTSSGATTGGTTDAGGSTSEGGAGADAGCAIPAAAASCSVKFSTDIFPKFASTGTWQCTSSICHAAGSGTSPTIDGTSATTAYNSMLNTKLSTSATLMLLNPCSTNVADSGIVGLFNGTAGSQKMPTSPGSATAADITTLTTWVQCGAPNN